MAPTPQIAEVIPAVVDPVAVFEGAISANPTSMTEATLPGQSTSISFVAASKRASATTSSDSAAT